MKKILLSFFVLLLIGLTNSTNAQCTFANPGIRIVAPPFTNPDGKCVITFELSYDILHNPGGKYFWIHLWPTNAYPNYSYPVSNPPTTSIIPGGNGALDGSIATFGFFHQSGALDIQTAYPPDGNAPNLQTGYIISTIEGGGILPGSDRYTVNGLTMTLPLNCSIPQSFTADLWESQSAQSQTVACFSKAVVIYANDPKLTGFLVCQAPRTYNFSIATINTTGLVVSYKVYIDNGDGIFDKAVDTINVASGSNLQLDNTNNYRYNSGVMTYLPYSNQKPYSDRALWVVVTSPSIFNETYLKLDNACIPLPVELISFTAVRNHTDVLLTWTTASEHNNKGFAVERNINGVWEPVAYVLSKASGGNSDMPLTYVYNDINNVKGITEYRIRQEDFDMRSRYSNVIAVRSETQVEPITVYPNPSEGSVNVVFETATVTRDISLTDMAGRNIKQWRNLAANNLRIDNLNAGIYFLLVINIETGEQQVEKIIVK